MVVELPMQLQGLTSSLKEKHSQPSENDFAAGGTRDSCMSHLLKIKSLELGLEVRQAVYGAFMALYDFSDGEKDYDSLLEAKKTLWELVSGYDEKLFNELQKKK